MHRCCSVSGFWWNFSINLFISIWINGTGNKCLDSVNLIFQSWSVVAPCVWVKHDRLWQHLIALTHAPSNYHFNGFMMFMRVYWRWWRYQIMHTERERERNVELIEFMLWWSIWFQGLAISNHFYVWMLLWYVPKPEF